MSDVARYQEVGLVELVDRVLAKGVVLSGDITLAVADVDLIRVELRAVIAAVVAIERRRMDEEGRV